MPKRLTALLLIMSVFPVKLFLEIVIFVCDFALSFAPEHIQRELEMKRKRGKQ